MVGRNSRKVRYWIGGSDDIIPSWMPMMASRLRNVIYDSPKKKI